MEDKKGYDVLKFVTHGDRCYMSTDYIRGKPMSSWLKFHSHLAKAQFYGWARELLTLLDNFHKGRGNPCYQYVNPYSIIVGDDGKIHLLDLASKEQDEVLHFMQRRSVRESFLSPENQYYQKSDIAEDLYGVGKTMQYILSVVELEPGMGRLEELRLQKLIAESLGQRKKHFRDYQELLRQIPEMDAKVQKSRRRNRILAMLTAGGFLAVGVMIGAQLLRPMSKDMIKDTESILLADAKEISEEQLQEKQAQWNMERHNLVQDAWEKERDLIYDLVEVYLTEVEDYKVCVAYLDRIEKEDVFAEDLSDLCQILDEQRILKEDQIKERIRQLAEEIPDDEDDRYATCIEYIRQQLNDMNTSE